MDKQGEERVFNMDDKDLVIISVTVIAIVSLFVISEPATIVTAIVSGLFGIAVGRKDSK
jgi:hypothetical protein